MRCDVLVGGTDKGYNRAFIEFLVKSNSNQFNMTLIETAEEILTALLSDGFDMYLIEEEIYLTFHEKIPTDQKSKCMILTESMTSVDTRQVYPVLKYQKVSSIEAIMVERFKEMTTDEMVTSGLKSCRLVSFYSPVGGVGTSTLSEIFAQVRCSGGYKVLFVSFEDFPSHEAVFHCVQKHNMSDYMVFLLSQSNWLLGLKRMISEDMATGIAYLKPALNGKDLVDFPWSMWHQWLAYIMDMSDYDYIVVDVGRRLFEGGMKILEISHHRVYVTSNDIVAEKKWQTYLAQVQQIGSEDLLTDRTLLCTGRMACNRITGHKFDALLTYDSSLYKTGKEGMLHLNPQSNVYKQVEVVLSHV